MNYLLSDNYHLSCNGVFFTSKSGSTSRLRSLKTLTTKSTPVYALQVKRTSTPFIPLYLTKSSLDKTILWCLLANSSPDGTFYLLLGLSQSSHKLIIWCPQVGEIFTGLCKLWNAPISVFLRLVYFTFNPFDILFSRISVKFYGCRISFLSYADFIPSASFSDF